MKVAVDISLYPLQEDLIPPIKNVIERLKSHDNLYVDTNSMSTQIRGEYDDPEHEGDLSHFQALTTALSATVGIGNIAGVAVAVSIGGPGATFWMIVAGLLGMSSKFVECTLGVKYRNEYTDGTVSGGPMYYLSKGLAERGGRYRLLGRFLAVLFAVF